MDQSRTYIHMCRVANEIQNRWNPEPGDLFVDGSHRIRYWIPEAEPPRFKKGFHIVENENLIALERFTWLPRHPQLMELAQRPDLPFRETTFRFHEWASPKDGRHATDRSFFVTLEQLWLGFIMKTLYAKTWNGSEWVSRLSGLFSSEES